MERYNRIRAEEFLYARSWQCEQQRSDALRVWNIHYNYHRPHGAAGNQPPAVRLPLTVTNVLSSYIPNAFEDVGKIGGLRPRDEVESPA